MRLDGKVALVTGGTRGIGEAICYRLAREGAGVAVLGTDAERAHRVAHRIGEAGGKAIPVQADVTQEAHVNRAVAEIVRNFGKLDILVNNAGTIVVSHLVDTAPDDWERVFRVNVHGVFLCCKAAAKQMITQGSGGRIVNCSSGAGRRGNAFIAAYAASKFAVIGITQSLAVELAPHHIAVNAIAPGHVTVTPMWEFIDAEFARLLGVERGATKRAVADEPPLKRVGTPEEIAAAVAFLASDDASYVTGATLSVDGGLMRF